MGTPHWNYNAMNPDPDEHRAQMQQLANIYQQVGGMQIYSMGGGFPLGMQQQQMSQNAALQANSIAMERAMIFGPTRDDARRLMGGSNWVWHEQHDDARDYWPFGREGVQDFDRVQGYVNTFMWWSLGAAGVMVLVFVLPRIAQWLVWWYR